MSFAVVGMDGDIVGVGDLDKTNAFIIKLIIHLFHARGADGHVAVNVCDLDAFCHFFFQDLSAHFQQHRAADVRAVIVVTFVATAHTVDQN